MGERENWLLLRGLAREQRHWGSFPEVFESTVPGAKVHCLDLPGVGTEHRRGSPLTIDGITGDLRRRWSLLKAEHEGPWSLLAVSLGGMVSMHWGAKHGGDFQSLVVINSSTRDLSRPLERLKVEAIPSLARAMMEEDPITREKVILGFTSRERARHEEAARRAAELLKDAPIRRSTALSQLAAAATFRTPARIETPMLFLAGGADGMVDPVCALRLARHFSAPLHVHPTGGHELSLDAPEWIAEQVANWRGRGR